MKTTIDIADHIMLRAKKLASRRNRTLKSLTEEGLLYVLDHAEAEQQTEIRPVTFKGNGLAREFEGREWSSIRDAAYEGRGA